MIWMLEINYAMNFATNSTVEAPRRVIRLNIDLRSSSPTLSPQSLRAMEEALEAAERRQELVLAADPDWEAN